MSQKLRSIKDTHREFTELLSVDADVAEFEDDGDDLLEMDSYSESEKPAAKRCCDLLLLAMDAIKASDAVMIKVNDPSLRRYIA